jgi:hypothetical protein
MRPEDVLRGFTRHPMADGFVLVPPGGTQAGVVRVREKLPLRPLRAFVDEALREAGPEAARAAQVGPLERLTTVEGEHAGVVTIAFDLPGGVRLERTLALVAGDDLGALIDAAAVAPADFPAYRQLVRALAGSFYLGLGAQRRRRFEHAPPPGWEALARPHVTTWYAPGFPRTAAFIAVHDARPRAASEAEHADRSLSLLNAALTIDAHEPLALPSGLAGFLERGQGTEDGRTIHVRRALLSDARFTYVVQLNADEAALPDAVPALDALLGSIVPIPAPGAESPEHASPWLD